MMIPDLFAEMFIDYAGRGALSGIQIYCDNTSRDVIADDFDKTFCKLLKKEFLEIFKEHADRYGWGEEEMEGCYDTFSYDQFVKSIDLNDDGLFVNIGGLDVYTTEVGIDKERCDSFDELLDYLILNHKNITIDGYICYFWSYELGGEIEQFPVYRSNAGTQRFIRKTDVYDFIGERISRALIDDDFYEYLFERYYEDYDDYEDEDTEELVEFLKKYRDWITAEGKKKLLDNTKKFEDEYYKSFDLQTKQAIIKCFKQL